MHERVLHGSRTIAACHRCLDEPCRGDGIERAQGSQPQPPFQRTVVSVSVAGSGCESVERADDGVFKPPSLAGCPLIERSIVGEEESIEETAVIQRHALSQGSSLECVQQSLNICRDPAIIERDIAGGQEQVAGVERAAHGIHCLRQ
ncbi:MAG TPA: hypothetical protein VII52_05105 [Gemmatimonadaceae bacterium]